MITQEYAKELAIEDWKKLPVSDRQTINDAAMFAIKEIQTLPFHYAGRKDRLIRNWIVVYQKSIGQSLKDN